LGARRGLSIGIFAILIFVAFSITPAFAWKFVIQNPDDLENLPPWVLDNAEIISENQESKTDGKNSGNTNEHYTKPTFGLDHENNQKIIDSGFKINNQTFSINDNFHTPFKEQVVKIGETNTFEAKLFASEGLRVQEFLFGISEVGQAHNAELGIEVWFDHNGARK
jgi:hypothetical protein